MEGRDALGSQLAQGLRRLGLGLPAAAHDILLDYVVLLGRWNRVYNLTAVRDPHETVSRHLLDSLSVAPFVQGSRVIDVGTGAGLPGIPLAVALPERHFVLLDSSRKKTRFVTQAVAELALGNVAVVQARVEDYRPGIVFDTVVCRAFASLADIIAGTRHLYGTGSRLVAMKGELPQAEIAALPPDFRVQRVAAVQVPGLAARRHVVCVEPAVAEECA